MRWGPFGKRRDTLSPANRALKMAFRHRSAGRYEESAESFEAAARACRSDDNELHAGLFMAAAGGAWLEAGDITRARASFAAVSAVREEGLGHVVASLLGPFITEVERKVDFRDQRTQALEAGGQLALGILFVPISRSVSIDLLELASESFEILGIDGWALEASRFRERAESHWETTNGPSL